MRRIISALLPRSSTKYWLGLSFPRGSIGVGMLGSPFLRQVDRFCQQCFLDLLPHLGFYLWVREGSVTLQQRKHPLLKLRDRGMLSACCRHRAQANALRDIKLVRLKSQTQQIGVDLQHILQSLREKVHLGAGHEKAACHRASALNGIGGDTALVWYPAHG